MAFLPLAVAFGAFDLWRRRRPVTRSRVGEVALSTILLVMVGLRYGALAVLTAAAPAAVLGPAVPPVIDGLCAGIFAALSAAGFIAFFGSVGWRFGTAIAFAGVALAEALGNLLLFGASAATMLDTSLSVALAAVTIVLAALYWTRRAATPDPLGSSGGRIDY